ncbi:MAG: PAS domain S-box protein [Nitrospiraceae bacterium]
MITAASEQRILIVDDDPDICVALQDLLRHDGYHVVFVGTCKDAFAAFRRSHYNAVLLDVGLPDGDGLSVLPVLQDLDPSLPVIILTAFTTTERTIGSLSKGAFAYLTKPYNRDELRATLTRAAGVKALAVKAESVEHALAESEARFRSLVESATDAIVLADQTGSIISWNRAAATMFGYADYEVLDKPLTLLMPVRYREAHEQGLARVRDTGETRLIGKVIALHGLRKDGIEFPLELGLATWRTSSGAFYSGIIRDTTERTRAEEALNRLRHQHALILTQAGEGIYGIDAAGITTFVNPTAAKWLGYEEHELLGQPMHPLLHHTKPDGSHYPVDHCPIHAAMRDGRVRRVTTEVFWRKDRSSFPVKYVSTPIREEGRIVGVVVVFSDISEQKRAEAVLKQSEERYRTLFEDNPSMYFIVDTAGTVVSVNRFGAEQLGYTPEELIGQSVLQVFYEADREAVTQKVAACLEQPGRALSWEFRKVRKDGTLIWVHETAKAMRDADNRSVVLIVCEDITKRRRAEAALRWSEERLELAVRGSTDGLWDGRPFPDEPWSSPRTPVWWSPRFKAMLGFGEDEFPDVLASWIDRLHPDDHERVFAALTAHIERREPYDVEYRLQTKQGDYQWFRARGQGMWDTDGRLLRMSGSLQSVSDRKQAEEELLRTTNRLQAILDNSPAVIQLKDAQGRYTLVNSRWQSLFGISAEEAIGKTVYDIFPKAVAETLQDNDHRVLQADTPLELEEHIPQRDGLHTYISVKFPLHDAAGSAYGVCGISTDITERKHAEQALRASEERLRLALSAAHLGVWDWNVQSGSVFWSESVEGLFGLPPGAFAGTYAAYLELIYLEDRGIVLQTIQQALHEGMAYEIEHRIVWPDGSLHWLACSGQVTRDESGKAVRVLGTVRDVTARKLR